MFRVSNPFSLIATKSIAAIIFIFSLLIITVDSTPAEITLGLPFADHMVLQRNVTVPVWGKASPAETVTVLFRGQSKTTKTGEDGKWLIRLDPTDAGGPFEFFVEGSNRLKLVDVMVGEVWICSGQSNMANSLKSFGGSNLDSAMLANYSDIRLMSDSPILRKWQQCTPTAALSFSATAFYFALNLYRTLKIPVGVITAAIGGTKVERWMDSTSYKADPILGANAMKNDLFAAYIYPLVPFANRGFIWYQGEANANDSTGTYAYYRERFGALIKGWRKVWGMGEIPFYFVQLSSYRGTIYWPLLREAQRLNLALPNTAMAVTMDIGDSANIHPINKWEVGRRLALPARALLYGEKELIYSGPIYESSEIRGKSLRLRFRFAESGLVAKDLVNFQTGGKLVGFTLAGSDSNWYPANAVIEKDTVILTSPNINQPAKARYAWASVPHANLYNGAGMPASPFQTEGLQLPVSLNENKVISKDLSGKDFGKAQGIVTDALGRDSWQKKGERISFPHISKSRAPLRQGFHKIASP